MSKNYIIILSVNNCLICNLYNHSSNRFYGNWFDIIINSNKNNNFILNQLKIILNNLIRFYFILSVIGAAFVGIFSERLFVSSILHKIYQIDKIREEEIRKTYLKSKDNNSTQVIDTEFANGNIFFMIFIEFFLIFSI